MCSEKPTNNIMSRTVVLSFHVMPCYNTNSKSSQYIFLFLRKYYFSGRSKSIWGRGGEQQYVAYIDRWNLNLTCIDDGIST